MKALVEVQARAQTHDCLCGKHHSAPPARLKFIFYTPAGQVDLVKACKKSQNKAELEWLRLSHCPT